MLLESNCVQRAECAPADTQSTSGQCAKNLIMVSPVLPAPHQHSRALDTFPAPQLTPRPGVYAGRAAHRQPERVGQPLPCRCRAAALAAPPRVPSTDLREVRTAALPRSSSRVQGRLHKGSRKKNEILLLWHAQILEVLLEQRNLSEQEVCTAVEVRPYGAGAACANAAPLRTLTNL